MPDSAVHVAFGTSDGLGPCDIPLSRLTAHPTRLLSEITLGCQLQSQSGRCGAGGEPHRRPRDRGDLRYWPARRAAGRRGHAAADRYNQSVEQRWDSQDKRNQAFSNYLLDQTVIHDNQNTAHVTVRNQTADTLVRNNDPQRFEYVSRPNYLKGVDY